MQKIFWEYGVLNDPPIAALNVSTIHDALSLFQFPKAMKNYNPEDLMQVTGETEVESSEAFDPLTPLFRRVVRDPDMIQSLFFKTTTHDNEITVKVREQFLPYKVFGDKDGQLWPKSEGPQRFCRIYRPMVMRDWDGTFQKRYVFYMYAGSELLE